MDACANLKFSEFLRHSHLIICMYIIVVNTRCSITLPLSTPRLVPTHTSMGHLLGLGSPEAVEISLFTDVAIALNLLSLCHVGKIGQIKG